MDNKNHIPFQTENIKEKSIKNLQTSEAKANSKDEVVKPDNKDFTYTYVLSTASQKKQIDLIKYKKQLQEIFKNYFGDKLISSTVKKDKYTLVLKDEYTKGEKIQVGKTISTKTDLNKYAKRVAYNGGQDKSGQIFVIQKKEQINATNTK